MKINFENYKVFYYVGKFKNFTRAARELQTSQSETEGMKMT